MYDERARVLRPAIEPGRRVLVISDIHANLPYFHGLLKKVGFCDDDVLLLNGDFLEKGAESLKTLREVMALTGRGNVIPVMGNCDDWAALFRENSRWTENLPRYMRYRKSGLLWDMALELGLDPLALPDFETFKRLLAARFAQEFAFLDRLPQAVRAGRFTFAHAAVYPGKPLEEHTVGELLRCEAWYDLGYRFDDWVVVGHYPVMLYGKDIVCANPVIDRARHIACIDGACVLKDDGQLNCLIIPDITGDELSFDAYDPFPVRTGRSDYPNQVNNVLCFPGIFRGALDVRASDINDEMKLAAAAAIAGLVSDEELSADYILPKAFDPRVKDAVAKATAEAARRSGVARI